MIPEICLIAWLLEVSYDVHTIAYCFRSNAFPPLDLTTYRKQLTLVSFTFE